MKVYIQHVKAIKDTYQLYGMIYAYDFIVTWFANSDNNFSIQPDDNVFLHEIAGNNQFYSDEELKKAIKREIDLQFKSA